MKKLMIITLTLLCCLGTAFAVCNAGSISTPAELQNLNQCLGDNYKDNNYFLANDIDLSGITWQPIGNSSNHFSGKLNGKGHKVFGFNINSSSADYVGLFGYVSSSAEIKNISVTINGTVRGKNYVGGLAGYNLGKISNSYVTGNVSGNEYVGGLAGKNGGTIIDCYATMGGVLGSKYVGGLAGSSTGTVKNNYFVGTIEVPSSSSSSVPVTPTCFISGCYVSSGSTADVPPPTFSCGEGVSASSAKFSITSGNHDIISGNALSNWNNNYTAHGISTSNGTNRDVYMWNLTCDGEQALPNGSADSKDESKVIKCGTIHTVKTVAECFVASSSSVSSSSSAGPCVYESTWCGGKNIIINSSTKPTTGQCVFVKVLTKIQITGSGTNEILINNTSCTTNGTPPCPIPSSTKDGGYYIYVKTGSLSNDNANYVVTAGSPDCDISSLPISSSSSSSISISIPPDSIMTLALNPGRNISELNFNWYSGTGTDKTFVRIVKNGNNIYFTGTYGPASAGYQWHRATVTGLDPNTTYTYNVSNDGTNWSPDYTFKTPTTSGNFKFAAISDVQPNCTSKCTDDIIGPWQRIARKIDSVGATLIVNGGDHADYAREYEFDGYFSPPELRSIPTAPVMGNHDSQKQNPGNYSFDYHFNLPNVVRGTANYNGVANDINSQQANYYFLYNRILFIGLNTSQTPANENEAKPYIADFRATIDAAKTAHSPLQYDFIVVTHHKSTNSVTSSTEGHEDDDDVRAYVAAGLQKLMTEKGVDLVLTGHNHIYVRSLLMYDDRPSEEKPETTGKGTYYMTLKPAGITRNYAKDKVGWTDAARQPWKDVYPFFTQPIPFNSETRYVPVSYFIHDQYGTSATATNGTLPGYTIIEVNNRVMYIKSYKQDGTTVIDQFEITPTLPKF